MKKVLVTLALITTTQLVGCATMNGVQNKLVNNTTEGVFYGSAGISNTSIDKFCDVIKNKDPRCADKGNYVVVSAFSKIGFYDGVVGMTLLAPKDFPNLEKLNFKGWASDKDAPFVKARVIAGQYGELLEIVSTDGDGVCYWGGLNKAGGVVCPKFNYSYTKDYLGVVYR